LVQDYSLAWLDVLDGGGLPGSSATAAACSRRDGLPGSAAAFPAPGSRLLLALVGAGLPRAPGTPLLLLLALVGSCSLRSSASGDLRQREGRFVWWGIAREWIRRQAGHDQGKARLVFANLSAPHG
jgi:hypothetical protein